MINEKNLIHKIGMREAWPKESWLSRHWYTIAIVVAILMNLILW